MSDAVTSILMLIGLLMLAIGGVWITVVTFKKSVAWGLGSLFLPIVGLVFVVKYWNECWRPTAISLLGCVAISVGFLQYFQAHPELNEDPFARAMQKGKLE